MRDELDRYYTPDDVAQLCVDALPEMADGTAYPYVRVFEPSVGGGAFVRACRARWGEDTHVIGCDIDRHAPGWAEVNVPLDGSLLDVHLPESDVVDLCVGNPPYIHAEAHAARLLAQGYPVVALLLRLGFLASRERVRFWMRHPLSELHVLSERPSFTGDGKTDASDYGLFVWRDHDLTGEPQRFRWLSRLMGERGLSSIRWADDPKTPPEER